MRKELMLYICIWALLPLIAKGQVVISEIQVANVDMYIDPSFNYGSWVELYNTSKNMKACPFNLNDQKTFASELDNIINTLKNKEK